MGIRRFFALTAVIVLPVVGLFAGVAYAASSDRVVQGTINHSVYEAGTTVTVNGTVNGDIFCAGQTVTINATVNGDVLCAGQDITVNGRVNGNVRLAGQTVNLGAQVVRSASIAGQSVNIESAASVGRDASLAVQTATVNGRVARDLTGAGNTITLGSSIGRNVLLQVNKLNLVSGADIAGNVTYTSPQVLQRSGGAQSHGTVTYHKAAVQRTGISAGWIIWAALYWAVALIALGVVLVALFPQLFRRWNVVWGANFWWAVLTGFIAMFAVPVIAVVLMLTAVGVPLGILLILLWIVAALLAMPLAAYFTGSLVAPRVHPVLTVLVGSVVLGLLELIPFVGWLIGLIAYWLGSGMLLMGLKRHYVKPVYKLGDG